ncbi:MAG: helix-turn-helix domain-containing protein [Sandaracinaceae bacterium]
MVAIPSWGINTTMIERFGDALRAVRRELGLSQEAVAHAVGTTQRHVSFLETGRSEPTRAMLGRLVAGLGLTAAHRAALFAASGFHNPYPRRSLEGAELQAILDLMSRQVLRHWPFPAFVVDRDWNFLRMNEAGARMSASFGRASNMHTLFLSPAFSATVINWEQASGSFYTRIQEVARRSPAVRAALDAAIEDGRFDHVTSVLGGLEEVPVYVPIEVELPNGARMRFTSMHGRWAAVHDAVAEQFEMEFLVPLDEASEAVVGAVFGDDAI